MSVIAYRAAPTRVARVSLALLLSINLFNYIDRYILAAVEPEIRKDARFFKQEPESGKSAREQLEHAMASTGSLATAFLVSYMVAAPIFGWLADRMSRWLLVAIAVAVWSLASGASGLATTFTLLLITRCFVGIGEAGYGPAAPAIIAELYPPERRGAVLSWFYMAIPVGSALGYVFGGLVAGKLGWRWPFFLVVPPGILLAIWALRMRRTEVRAKEHAQTSFPVAPTKKRGRGVSEYLDVLRIPSYLLDTAGMAAMTFAIGGFSFWMPAYLVDGRKLGDLASVNFYFGIITVVCGITSTLLGGWLGDYFRRYTSGSYFIVSAVGILLSAGFIALMVRTPFPMAWVWLSLGVFFLFLNTGPSNAILANVTTQANRANAFAMNILIIHALGDAISPPILGKIAGRSWDHALYLVCAVMVLAAALWLWGAAYLKRDMDRAAAVDAP